MQGQDKFPGSTGRGLGITRTGTGESCVMMKTDCSLAGNSVESRSGGASLRGESEANPAADTKALLFPAL